MDEPCFGDFGTSDVGLFAGYHFGLNAQIEEMESGELHVKLTHQRCSLRGEDQPETILAERIVGVDLEAAKHVANEMLRIHLSSPEFLQNLTSALVAAEKEYFDRVWYVRSCTRMANEGLSAPMSVEIGAATARAKIEAKYGREDLEKALYDAWQYGFISGKLSALRWALGEE
jgi:uncharacterized protein (DUF736 family)